MLTVSSHRHVTVASWLSRRSVSGGLVHCGPPTPLKECNLYRQKLLPMPGPSRAPNRGFILGPYRTVFRQILFPVC